MKKLILLIFIPVLLFGQGPYSPKTQFPFYRDTLFVADTVTGGWCYIGDKIGAQTFGIILDSDSGIDSVVAITVQARLSFDDFLSANGGALDDSAGTSAVGWMTLGTIDSTFISDSLAWYLPLADETWWTWFDWIRFRLISPATNDSCWVVKAVLKGQ